MVVLGWMMGQPMSLDFNVFETISLLLTVVIMSVILSSGKSDWLYGVMMLMAYFIISAAFWLQLQPADLK
jgi:Ca2+:H+ antiporter